ncbi:MAG: HRDC domain-containing protein [Actinomycetota bacterium]|nr:HRDC domain-containing protein [Actinomycetota bacterium]
MIGLGEYHYVEHGRALEEVASHLARAEVIAIDTEFHREKSYFAKLALVQIAAAGEVFIIDPLRLDLTPLADVFEGGPEVVLHAATQDLEILRRKVGTVPSRICDTQIAAGFLGYSTPSLALLLETFLGVRLDKTDRLSDWMARPLEPKQLDYAAQDVLYLVELRDILMRQLQEMNRLDWLSEELADFLSQGFRFTSDPARSWTRIREVKALKGRARHLGMALAAWREERAMELDIPVRYVLADLAVATVAQAAPRRTAELRSIRGVELRNLANGVDKKIVEVIEKALVLGPPTAEEMVQPEAADIPPGSAALLSAWLTSRAKALHIDPNLLGTRSDLNEVLAGTGNSRLSRGWRKEAVGGYLERIIAGEIALYLTSSGEVSMVENTGAKVD